MLDLLYVLGTVGFFVACIACLSACERLGRRADDEQAR